MRDLGESPTKMRKTSASTDKPTSKSTEPAKPTFHPAAAPVPLYLTPGKVVKSSSTPQITSEVRDASRYALYISDFRHYRIGRSTPMARWTITTYWPISATELLIRTIIVFPVLRVSVYNTRRCKAAYNTSLLCRCSVQMRCESR